jgi:DnaJ-domain-containing protein 1
MREAYPLTWPDGWKRVPYRTRSRFEVSGFGKARDFLLAEIRRMGGRYGKREMCFACDAYVTVRENAYAIAKSIEALRGIERWGASDMMERAFRGFAALAATSQEGWWDVLECLPSADIDTINAQYRVRARSAHPDAGGSHDAMSRLNAARDSALATLQGVTL